MANELQTLSDAGHNGGQRVFAPFADVIEADDHFRLMADVPGVDEKDMEVTLENGVLTLRGRASQRGVAEHRLAHQEYETGDYRRVFTLSPEVKPEGITAHVRNGVLTVTLPKAEAARPRRIEVRTN